MLGFDPRQMQIVPAASNSPFQLPEGWIVEVRPRRPNSSVIMSDKYYYEPGSGRQFRSLASIKRYLTGEEEPLPRKKQSNCLVPCQNSGSFRRVVYGGKFWSPDELEEVCQRKLDVVSATVQPKSSAFPVPDGWIVEEVPRKSGLRSDRYYIEPETGQKFRSVPEVQRYLAGKKYKSKRKVLTTRNHSTAPRTPAPHKMHTSAMMLKDGIFDLTNPPEKIRWVYSGDGRDKWRALMDECMIPDNVKEQWKEIFLLAMNGWKNRVPQLTMS